MVGRVFNGQEWEEVVLDRPVQGKQQPLLPIFNGDGKIFVSIPSFRGMWRSCSMVEHNVPINQITHSITH